MARPGITQTEVFKIANQLTGQGDKPTIELIRRELGTGSNSTIAGFLREWRHQHSLSSIVNGNELPDDVLNFMTGAWQRLYAQANDAAQALQAEAQEQLATSKQTLEALTAQYNELLASHKETSQGKLLLQEQLHIETQQLTEKTKDNEGLLQQLQDKEALVAEMRILHQRAQENLEHFRESTRLQRLEEQALQAEQLQYEQRIRQAAEQQLKITEADRQQLFYRHQEATKDLEKLNNEYHAALNELKLLTNLHHNLEQTYQQVEVANKHRQQQHQQLEQKYLENTQQLSAVEKDTAVLNHQLIMLQHEMQSLKDLNQQLTDEKIEILQEKAQLVGVNQQLQTMLEKGIA
ncbi:MAG: DNA-binding protein [Gammaproteobacteria bacterium]